MFMYRLYPSIPSLYKKKNKEKKITFQIANKLADLVPWLTRNTFEFWLGLPLGVNVAKQGVNLAVPFFFLDSPR